MNQAYRVAVGTAVLFCLVLVGLFIVERSDPGEGESLTQGERDARSTPLPLAAIDKRDLSESGEPVDSVLKSIERHRKSADASDADDKATGQSSDKAAEKTDTASKKPAAGKTLVLGAVQNVEGESTATDGNPAAKRVGELIRNADTQHTGGVAGGKDDDRSLIERAKAAHLAEQNAAKRDPATQAGGVSGGKAEPVDPADSGEAGEAGDTDGGAVLPDEALVNGKGDATQTGETASAKDMRLARIQASIEAAKRRLAGAADNLDGGAAADGSANLKPADAGNPPVAAANAAESNVVTVDQAARVIQPTQATHIIIGGDTLGAIARRHYGHERYWQQIAKANPGIDPRRLKQGVTIKLPAISVDAPPRAAEKTDAAPPPGEGQLYTIRDGDRLWSLAKRFYGNGARWTHLYRHNKAVIGKDPHRLPAGKQIRIVPLPVVAGGDAVDGGK